MLEEKITIKGIAALLLCAAAPLIRLVFGGVGLLTWILPLVAVLVFINSKKTIKLTAIQVAVISISLLMIFSCLYSPSIQGFRLENIKVQICSILLFLCLINRKEQNILIFIYYAIACFFIYCYFFSSEFYLGGIRKYIILQGSITMDPNMIVVSFIVPMIYSVQYLIKGERRSVKILMILFLSLSLYGTFLGGSRGGLIGIFVGIIYYLVKSINLQYKHMLTIIATICVGIIAFLIVRSYIPESLLARMTWQSVQESGGSGRFNIYKTYLSKFFDDSGFLHMLFGYGKESCKAILGKSAHNIIIDYLWDLGIVGLTSHFVVSFLFLKQCIKSKCVFSISCLISTLIWSLTISSGDQLIYWVLLYSCYVISVNYKNQMNSV